MSKIQEILPEFGCYIGDMEANLGMDQESYDDYQSDPGPYISDLLGDFGTFDADLTWKEKGEMIEVAVAEYLGN